LFGRINKMKYELRVKGVDVIDLGMGNPTDPTPKPVVEKLMEASQDPRNHRYSVSNGIAGLRKEVAKKYKKKYQVELDPDPNRPPASPAPPPASGLVRQPSKKYDRALRAGNPWVKAPTSLGKCSNFWNRHP
jgi:hypothetical protein